MIKAIGTALVVLLCTTSIPAGARAAETTINDFSGAVVWANPPAAASGSTETDSISLSPNLLQSSADPSIWGFVPKDPQLDTITAEDGAIHVKVGKSDGLDYHYQVGQSNLKLQEGQTYVLSFRAKADAVRAITVSAQAVGGDWHTEGLGSSVPLTLDWQSSKITFVAKNVTSDTQLVFNVGQQNGSIWIADVSLVPQTVAAAPPITASALKVDVTASGSGIQDVQTISKPFSLTNGQAYTLSFMARSDTPRKELVTVRINAPDWHSVSAADPSLLLGADWRLYSINITPTAAGPGNNVVAFSMGGQTGSVWIANLKLTTSGATK